MRGITLLLMCIAVALVAPAGAMAAKQRSDGGTAAATAPAAPGDTGASAFGVDADDVPREYVDGTRAKRLRTGYAAAPADAPVEVQEAVFAANEIIGRPYVYGGGHTADFKSEGYDCSGTISYALHGGGLLDAPLPSGDFMSWGERGKGDWITVYAHGGHAYVVIAGLRLDTSSAGERRSSGRGPRWRKTARSSMRGFRKRHPEGF